MEEDRPEEAYLKIVDQSEEEVVTTKKKRGRPPKSSAAKSKATGRKSTRSKAKQVSYLGIDRFQEENPESPQHGEINSNAPASSRRGRKKKDEAIALTQPAAKLSEVFEQSSEKSEKEVQGFTDKLLQSEDEVVEVVPKRGRGRGRGKASAVSRGSRASRRGRANKVVESDVEMKQEESVKSERVSSEKQESLRKTSTVREDSS